MSIQQGDKKDIQLMACIGMQPFLYERKRCSAEERSAAWRNVVATMIKKGFYSTIAGKFKYYKDTFFKCNIISFILSCLLYLNLNSVNVIMIIENVN